MAQVYKIAAIMAARIAGDDPVMDAAAARVANAAVALASAHRVTGKYISGIGSGPVPGKSGVTDRLVWVDDPAATFIEWGHMTRPSGGENRTHADVRNNLVQHGPQRWVPGLHIMGRAAGVR